MNQEMAKKFWGGASPSCGRQKQKTNIRNLKNQQANHYSMAKPGGISGQSRLAERRGSQIYR